MPDQLEFICIPDDDSSVRRSIEQLLDSDGLNALSFEDPDDFLAHVRTHDVPLAVLDGSHWLRTREISHACQ